MVKCVYDFAACELKGRFFYTSAEEVKKNTPTTENSDYVSVILTQRDANCWIAYQTVDA